MTTRNGWTTRSRRNGLWTVELQSWQYFHDFVCQKMLRYPQCIWRGQGDSRWQLSSSLDRMLKGTLHKTRPDVASSICSDSYWHPEAAVARP